MTQEQKRKTGKRQHMEKVKGKCIGTSGLCVYGLKIES